MLVKFGKVGSEIKEYCLEEGSTIQDLIDIADMRYDDNDIVKCTNSNELYDSYDWCDQELEEGDVLILETINFTDKEEKLIELIGETDVNDLSLSEQKELINEIIKLVNDNSWDK